MRVVPIIVALFSATAAIPAHAATPLVFEISGLGIGTKTVYDCDGGEINCVTTSPFQRFLSTSFSLLDTDFVNGVAAFSYGNAYAIGQFTGSIRSLGNGDFSTNFTYFASDNFAGCGFSCHAQYENLTVTNGIARQLVPLPVPEPATWAMMIVGFGLAGEAMRRRRYQTPRKILV